MKKKFLLFPLLFIVIVFAIVSCGPTGDNKENKSTECAHDNAEWRVVKEATCGAEGSKQNVCVSCGEILETQTISAKGHTYVNNKCECGSIQIADVAGLQAFAESLTQSFDYRGKTVTLIADLDMTDVKWKAPVTAFAGTFDGNGHTISNLKIQHTTEDYAQNVGLFYKNSGTILDLTLANVTLTYNADSAPAYVGCLAAENGGTVQNCHVAGTISLNSGVYSSSVKIGGLLGYNYGSVERSSAKVGINAYSYKQKGNSTFLIHAGGLIGESNDTVKDCFATGDVTVGAENYARAAGLIANAKGTIENCYATGNSSASIQTSGSSKYPCVSGALFASYETGDNGAVKNCFATGNVSANHVAGLVPMITVDVTNCYYAEGATINGSLISEAKPAGTATALDTIKTAAFGSTLTWSTDVWNFTDGAYPTLK